MLKFRENQLENIILELQRKNFCGIVQIETLFKEQQKSSNVLAFLNGELTYGGSYLPKPYDLSQILGKHFKLQVMDSALQLANKKIKDKSSIRQHLDLYVRLNLFGWQEVENFIHKQIVCILEQVLPCAGVLQLNTSVTFDLAYGEDGHGFDWHQLKRDITQRRDIWASLSPIITSIDNVPQRIEDTQQTITHAWIKQHLERWVDGQKTIGEIARQISKDPLELARVYLNFVQMGWLNFKHNQNKATLTIADSGFVDQTPSSQKQSTILSVDDSPIVQTMIRRAIGHRYNLLLANNAMDALGLLNSENVELLLLDVTMPEIDGLELCRTIRNIHKFRDLPVVMLTAKDGMFNKLKGQMAGSTCYLTKPIDSQKLLDVLERYLPKKSISEGT